MSELTVEFEEFGVEDPDGRVCACGCGEPIPPHSKRQYLYGHKKNAEEDVISDDPEPSDEAKVKAVRVTKAVRQTMQETIEGYLVLSAGAWEMADPICGAALSERASLIAEKLTPILARNQTFVRYFGRTSSFKEGMDLFLILWPVVKTVGQHHLFHTIGQVQEPETPVRLNGYVA